MSKSTWIAMLVAVVLLVGCGSAAQPAPPKTPEPFMLALPRLVVTVDNAGNPKSSASPLPRSAWMPSCPNRWSIRWSRAMCSTSRPAWSAMV